MNLLESRIFSDVEIFLLKEVCDQKWFSVALSVRNLIPGFQELFVLTLISNDRSLGYFSKIILGTLWQQRYSKALHVNPRIHSVHQSHIDESGYDYSAQCQTNHRLLLVVRTVLSCQSDQWNLVLFISLCRCRFSISYLQQGRKEYRLNPRNEPWGQKLENMKLEWRPQKIRLNVHSLPQQAPLRAVQWIVEWEEIILPAQLFVDCPEGEPLQFLYFLSHTFFVLINSRCLGQAYLPVIRILCLIYNNSNLECEDFYEFNGHAAQQ